eukprot:scaffold49151_cov69-Phaeocystis_antarctica.AAC.1
MRGCRVSLKRIIACNRMWPRLQPYVAEAATVCDRGSVSLNRIIAWWGQGAGQGSAGVLSGFGVRFRGQGSGPGFGARSTSFGAVGAASSQPRSWSRRRRCRLQES